MLMVSVQKEADENMKTNKLKNNDPWDRLIQDPIQGIQRRERGLLRLYRNCWPRSL